MLDLTTPNREDNHLGDAPATQAIVENPDPEPRCGAAATGHPTAQMQPEPCRGYHRSMREPYFLAN